VSLDELRCWLDVSRRQARVLTSRDSTADDDFDAVSIMRRREAAPGTGRVEQLRQDERTEDGLQSLVIHHSCRGCGALGRRTFTYTLPKNSRERVFSIQ